MKDKNKTKAQLIDELTESRRRVVGLEALEAEWKQAEEELHKLSSAVQQAADIIFITDREGVIEFVNPTFEKITGYSKEETLGQTPRILKSGLIDLKDYETLWNTILSGKEFRNIPINKKKDGELFYYDQTITPLKDQQRNITHFISTGRDITDRKRAEEEILRQAAVLQAINDVFREALTCETEEELGKTCLAIAEKLTDSAFGLILEINPAGLVDTIAISDPGWDKCETAALDARKRIKNMPIQGIDRATIREGKSRIVNRDEMATHPDRVGVPEGHPEIISFLGVPLKHEGETIGMIGLGNKEVGYDLADQEAVEILSVAIVEVFRKMRAEVERNRLFDLPKILIMLARSDATIVRVSAGWKDILDYAPDEMVGRSFLDFVHPDDIPESQSGVENVARGEVIQYFENRYRHKNGAYRTLSWVASADPDTGIHYGVAQDITEWKLVEDALRENTQMLSVIYKSVGDVLYYIGVEPDDSFRFLSINPAFMDATGLREEEIIGKHIEEIIPEPSIWMVLDQYKKAIKEKSIARWVETSVYPAGEKTGEVTIAPILDASGVCTHLVGTVYDITEHKKAEENLRNALDRLNIILDSLPVISYTCKAEEDFGATYISNNVFEQTGYKPEDFTSKASFWAEHIHPEDAPVVFENIPKIFEKGTHEHQYRWRIADGTYRWIYDSLRLVKKPDGEISHIVGMWEDITEGKQLEDQFRQSQKMEGIGRLAGGIAHDFNNILTVITGHSELALMSLDQQDPLRKDLVEIQKASDRAADLTRQLLAFSRKQALQPKVLNLNNTIKALHKMLRRIIGEDIDLEAIPEKGLWNTEADPGQIEQVIVNLAVNARDAMPSGGKLTIETQNLELDEEYASTHPDVTPGPHVMLAISDTGCGMTDEVKTKVFEPFFTTKGIGQGTGLGLSMVYGIVKQSGGNIWIYSELGQGTTFKIYLPRVTEKADKLIPKADISKAPRGTETVLVVEDEDGVRELACLILKQQGYKVLEAGSGGDALQICQKLEKPVDLVITDVVMPIMGGAEFVEKLREIWSDVKVLFMSGYTSNGIVHSGIIDKDTPYMQKPFRPAEIAGKVREVLDG